MEGWQEGIATPEGKAALIAVAKKKRRAGRKKTKAK